MVEKINLQRRSVKLTEKIEVDHKAEYEKWSTGGSIMIYVVIFLCIVLLLTIGYFWHKYNRRAQGNPQKTSSQEELQEND